MRTDRTITEQQLRDDLTKALARAGEAESEVLALRKVIRNIAAECLLASPPLLEELVEDRVELGKLLRKERTT
jgi:hypothetical protein